MVVRYNVLHPENVDAITARAKGKKDGVYEFRGIGFRVRDGLVTHYAVNGEVLERCFGFVVCIGKYDGYDRKSPLLKIKGAN